jgi:hypothetical protein
MITRRELAALLETRLEGLVAAEKMQELLAAIDELDEGWKELEVTHRDLGYSTGAVCPDICSLAEEVDRGAAFKLYRKRRADDRRPVL